MSFLLRTLLVLTTLAFFAGCDSSDPAGPDDPNDPIDPPDELPTLAIEDVSYVNKQVHNVHLDGSATSGYSRTMDLTIDFADEVTMDRIARLLIYGQTPASNLGWEIGRDELAELTLEDGAVLRIPNLVYLNEYYPSGTSDVYFEIVVEGSEAEEVSYDFIHKNRFPRPLDLLPSWYDREQLLVTFNYDCCTPISTTEAPTAFWIDEDVTLGSTEAAPSAELPNNARLFEDVPTTASALYTVVPGSIEGIETQVLTGIAELPERIGPNTTFVDGVELSGSPSLVQSDDGDGVYAIRDHQTNTVHVIRPDATVAGSFTLSENPSALHVTDYALYAGYSYGRLDAWDFASGERRTLGNYELEIQTIGTAAGYVLVAGRTPSYSEKLYVIDGTSGALMYESENYYIPNTLVYNERVGRVYMSYSSSRLYSMAFNPSTGVMSDFRESPYVSGVSTYPPFHLFPDQRALVTQQGTVFQTSSNASADMDYLGRFPYTMDDVAFLPETGQALALRSSYSDSPLDLYDVETRTYLRNVSVPGRVLGVTGEGSQVYVLSASDYPLSRLMVTALDADDLSATPRPGRLLHFVARPVSR